MLDILLDTVIDSLKLIPFLFITYLLMEYLEHKLSDKSKEKIKKSGKFGPLIRRFTWCISTMWIFSCSYKFLCSKSNYTRNIDFCISFNIWWDASNTYIRSRTNRWDTWNTCSKICARYDIWFYNRFCNKTKKQKQSRRGENNRFMRKRTLPLWKKLDKIGYKAHCKHIDIHIYTYSNCKYNSSSNWRGNFK